MSVSDLLLLDRLVEECGEVWPVSGCPCGGHIEKHHKQKNGSKGGADRPINQFSVTFSDMRLCEKVFQDRERYRLYKPYGSFREWGTSWGSGNMFSVSIHDYLWSEWNRNNQIWSVYLIFMSRFYSLPFWVPQASPPGTVCKFALER